MSKLQGMDAGRTAPLVEPSAHQPRQAGTEGGASTGTAPARRASSEHELPGGYVPYEIRFPGELGTTLTFSGATLFTDANRADLAANRAVVLAGDPRLHPHDAVAAALAARSAARRVTGDLDGAVADAAKALALTPERYDSDWRGPTRAELFTHRGAVNVLTNCYDLALDDFQAALVAAELERDSFAAARAGIHLASMFPVRDDLRSPAAFDRVLRSLDEVPAVDDVERGALSQRFLRMQALANMVSAYTDSKRFDEADLHLRRLRRYAMGGYYSYAVDVVSGYLRLAEGRVDEANRHCEAGLDAAVSVGDRYYEASALLVLAVIRGMQRRPAQAVEYLERAVELGSSYTWVRAHALQSLADLRASEGDAGAAYELLREATDLHNQLAKARSAVDAQVVGLFEQLNRRAAEAEKAQREKEISEQLRIQLEIEVARRTEELRAAKERLEDTLSEYKLLTSYNADLILKLTPDGEVTYASPSFERMLGIPKDQAFSTHTDDITHPDDQASLLHAFSRTVDLGESVDGEYRLRGADGQWFWAEVDFSPFDEGSVDVAELLEGDGPDATGELRASGDVAEVLCRVRDVTRSHRAEEELIRQSLTDPLTGLPNRRCLLERLGLILAASRATGRPVTLLYLDLDRFKLVNDTFGHHIGDALLISVAERLHGSLRGPDLVARLGGDEFVAVMPGLDPDIAFERADDLRKAVEQPWKIDDDHEMVPGVSVGVVVANASDRSAADLLREADTALYRAKERGRGRTEIYGAELRAETEQRFLAEQLVRDALDRGWFRLYYQPVVNIRTREIVSLEALARIEHPEKGILLPETFLEAAEDSGLMGVVGSWVLAEAIRQYRLWDEEGCAVPVSVNVGLRELIDRGAIDLVREAQLPAGALTVEVTERTLLDAAGKVLGVLHELKEFGASISLDDFGTAYSSITHLRELPIDSVKIDRTFIASAVEEPGDQAIIRAVCDLAEAFGCTAIAEGIETEAQLALVEELGCENAQGFMLGKPVPPEAVALARKRDRSA